MPRLCRPSLMHCQLILRRASWQKSIGWINISPFSESSQRYPSAVGKLGRQDVKVSEIINKRPVSNLKRLWLFYKRYENSSQMLNAQYRESTCAVFKVMSLFPTKLGLSIIKKVGRWEFIRKAQRQLIQLEWILHNSTESAKARLGVGCSLILIELSSLIRWKHCNGASEGNYKTKEERVIAKPFILYVLCTWTVYDFMLQMPVPMPS